MTALSVVGGLFFPGALATMGSSTGSTVNVAAHDYNGVERGGRSDAHDYN